MLAVIAAAMIGGCESARIGEPLTDKHAGNKAEARMAFWHSLDQRPITSNDEALHALLLLFDGKDPADNYAQRVRKAKKRGWLPGDFDQPADAAVRRGTLAVALAEELDIKGGVWMRLLGPTPRYATRELEYMGLFPPCSPQQTVSGAEFVGLISRVEDYQRANNIPAPAPQLPPEAPTESASS